MFFSLFLHAIIKTNFLNSKIMNFILSTYKSKAAIFCKTSKCFVLFGKKNELKKRLLILNNK